MFQPPAASNDTIRPALCRSASCLACGLRDNGRGTLIGTELEEAKIRRAQEHVAAAGLSDRVEFRAGDALETLRLLADRVDLVHLDGAFALYLPVLKTLEARLTPGALVISDNANAPDYLEYVRNPVLLAGWCGPRHGEVAELRRKGFNADCSVLTGSRAVTSAGLQCVY